MQFIRRALIALVVIALGSGAAAWVLAEVAGGGSEDQVVYRAGVRDATPYTSAEQVRDALAAQSFVLPPVTVRRGDAAAALARAPHTLSGSLEVGGQEHFYLEGQIAYVLPQEQNQWLVYSSTQHPGEAQHWVSHALGVDNHAVAAGLDFASYDNYPLGRTDLLMAQDPAESFAPYMRTGHPDFGTFFFDQTRGLAPGAFWIMEQQPGPVNWANHNPRPAPGMVRLWTLEAMAHRAELVSYFRWRQAPFAQEQMHAGLNRPDNVLDQGGREAALQRVARGHAAPRVHVAGGHGMWGIALGPLTGKMVADSMTGAQTPTVMSHFDPLR